MSCVTFSICRLRPTTPNDAPSSKRVRRQSWMFHDARRNHDMFCLRAILCGRIYCHTLLLDTWSTTLDSHASPTRSIRGAQTLCLLEFRPFVCSMWLQEWCRPYVCKLHSGSTSLTTSSHSSLSGTEVILWILAVRTQCSVWRFQHCEQTSLEWHIEKQSSGSRRNVLLLDLWPVVSVRLTLTLVRRFGDRQSIVPHCIRLLSVLHHKYLTLWGWWILKRHD